MKKMHVKNILRSLIVGCVGITAGAYAMVPGMYTGIDLGRSNVKAKPATILTDSSVHASGTGIGERLLFGYQYSSYFALEGGYAHYDAATYNVISMSGTKPAVRVSAFDLMGVGTLPMGANFGLEGRVGVAYVRASSSGSLGCDANGVCSTTQNGTKQALRPAFGVGVNYAFNQNWIVDLMANRIVKGSGVPEANLYALGVTYHFAEQCGQFLC